MTQREIAEYILRDVLNVTKYEELIEEHGYDIPRRVATISNKTLDSLLKKKTIVEASYDDWALYKLWYRAKVKEHALPSTLEEWRDNLTADSLYEVKLEKEDEEPSPVMTVTKPPSNSASFNIKFSDYPMFNGKSENWTVFKNTFKNIADVGQFARLIQVVGEKKLEEHEENMSQDNAYKESVSILYSVLAAKTANGIAASRVAKFEAEKDGVKAWNALIAYYEFSGDKDTYASTKLEELRNLQFTGNNYGGIDAYISKFLEICLELDRSGQSMSDIQKKDYFFQGIKNKEYNSLKDVLVKSSLEETIHFIRRKAQTLKTGNSDNNNRRQNNRKQNSGGRKKKNWKNDNKKTSSASGMTKDGRTRLPDNVWKIMPAQHKNYGMKKSETKARTPRMRVGRPSDGSTILRLREKRTTWRHSRMTTASPMMTKSKNIKSGVRQAPQ